MKTYQVQFVVAGTNELLRGVFRCKNKNLIYSHLEKNYGYCDYLTIDEI